ncbi:MAG: hypothetical protein V1870_01520 [Candidatus Aenigmatarchaeota archaeon]
MSEYCPTNGNREVGFRDITPEDLAKVPMRYFESCNGGYIVHDGKLHDMLGRVKLEVYPGMKN